MTLSDWITLSFSLFSLALTVVSIIGVYFTLKQNREMIENATRPYIIVSYETMLLTPKEVSRYIMVKNYGHSSAVILHMDCTGIDNPILLKQIQKLKGTTLAPGQRRLYYVGGQDNISSSEAADFSFSYKWGKNIYTENTTIRLVSGAQVSRHPNPSVMELTLQEIAERML